MHSHCDNAYLICIKNSVCIHCSFSLSQSADSSHSDPSDSAITLEEYVEVKQTLATSQQHIRQLAQSNHELKQEIAMLRSMVRLQLHSISLFAKRAKFFAYILLNSRWPCKIVNLDPYYLEIYDINRGKILVSE